MITATDIIDSMNISLKNFGEYSFMDKGPDEVMDTDSIVDDLLDWYSVEEISDIIKVVSNHSKFGKRLAETLVSSMDHMVDSEFKKLLELTGVIY